MFASGRCKWGDKCELSHTGAAAPAAEADAANTNTDSEPKAKGKAKAKAKAPGGVARIKIDDSPEVIQVEYEILGTRKPKRRCCDEAGSASKEVAAPAPEVQDGSPEQLTTTGQPETVAAAGQPAGTSEGRTGRRRNKRRKKTARPKRLWLCDTGCPYDLVGCKTIPPEDEEIIEPAQNPTTLETANGDVEVVETIPMQIDALKEVIDPYILDETPDVLSIGKRCEEMGYDFHWYGYSKRPFFVTPDGDKVSMTSYQCVPYLADDFNVVEAPSAVALPARCGAGRPAVPGGSSWEAIAYADVAQSPEIESSDLADDEADEEEVEEDAGEEDKDDEEPEAAPKGAGEWSAVPEGAPAKGEVSEEPPSLTDDSSEPPEEKRQAHQAGNGVVTHV